MTTRIQLIQEYSEAKNKILVDVTTEPNAPSYQDKAAQIDASAKYGMLIDSLVNALLRNDKPSTILKNRFDRAINHAPNDDHDSVYHKRFVTEVKPLLDKTRFSKNPGL